ncbi:hypothetical protein ACJRO7_013866 [Eucalyptus globulus]|uniref:Peptidase C1A papain C-terminal domain-containing protein n=1 Tax=Eucalyptus globulus TaxID=34317 RepID=A0ABD3KY77_EUCGL
MKQLAKISSKQLVRGLPKLPYQKIDSCTPCILGKQVRNSFKPINYVSTNHVLQLLHMDLFGPTRTQSIGGKKYCLVIVDNYSLYNKKSQSVEESTNVKFQDSTQDESNSPKSTTQEASQTLENQHQVTNQQVTGSISPVIPNELPSQAFEYIKYNGGLDTEEAYPYTAEDGSCKFSADNVGVQVLDSVNITLGAEDELKHAAAVVRPVSVAFQVVREFRFYKSGVYTSDTCGSTSVDVNHAVLAVGYGVEDGDPFWLIKNSWGADWGDHGYFKMEMGKNMCVATCASYPVVA